MPSRIDWGEGRKRDHCFILPLTLPTDTLYDRLGISPEVSDAEVRWALAQAITRIEDQQKRLAHEIEKIYERVEGLREAANEVEHLEKAHGEEREKRGAAVKRLNELTRTAAAVDGDFSQKRDRLKELDREKNEWNARALDQPEKRLAYDDMNPPLALLRLRDCTRDRLFLERRDLILLLRREIAAFLAERGEPVFHPSDLTRTDFTADFTFNAQLDKSPHER